MFVRVYQFPGGGTGPRSRAKTIALITVALGAGALLVAFALMLLLALAAAGTVIGAGVLIYRRLTGRSRHEPLARGFPTDEMTLDPRLEVFSDPVVRPTLPPDDSTRGA